MQDYLLSLINNIRSKKNLDPLEDLQEKMSLLGDLEFDSLDLAELTVRIENDKKIDIFEKEVVKTVGEIIVILEQ